MTDPAANSQRLLERYAAALEISGDAIYDCPALDPADPFDLDAPVYFSPQFCALAGYAPDELAPRVGSWVRLIARDDLLRLRDEFAAYVAGERAQLEYSYRVTTRAGELRWWQQIGRFLPSQTPGRRRLVGVVRDVTAARREAEGWRRQSDLLRQTQAAARVGGWEHDLATGQMYWTEETYRILELPPTFVPQPVDPRFFTPESLPLMAAAARGASERAVPFDIVVEIVTASGARKTVQTSGVPVVEDGRVVRVYGSFRDITEAKRAEVLRRRQADFMRQTQAVARVGGWEFDIAAGRVYWTEEAYRIHEVPPDYVPDIESNEQFFAPEHKPAISAAFHGCIERAEPFDIQFDLITYRGNRITVRTTGRPHVEDGRVTRLYGVFRDVTEDLRREAELRAQFETIRAQQTAIRELSAPVIQLWDEIVTLPVIGALDVERAGQIMDRLLSEVVRTRARFAILDLTGVEHVDTTTADQLFGIVRAVGLLGARAVLSGVGPGVAQTLTELGVELPARLVHRDLQAALQACLRELAKRPGPKTT